MLLMGRGVELRRVGPVLPSRHPLHWFSSFRFEPTWQSLELKGIALERTLSDATPGRSGAAQPAPFALVLLFQIRIARLARNYRGGAAVVASVALYLCTQTVSRGRVWVVRRVGRSACVCRRRW